MHKINIIINKSIIILIIINKIKLYQSNQVMFQNKLININKI
jgi:hypothetical protein